MAAKPHRTRRHSGATRRPYRLVVSGVVRGTSTRAPRNTRSTLPDGRPARTHRVALERSTLGYRLSVRIQVRSIAHRNDRDRSLLNFSAPDVSSKSHRDEPLSRATPFLAKARLTNDRPSPLLPPLVRVARPPTVRDYSCTDFARAHPTNDRNHFSPSSTPSGRTEHHFPAGSPTDRNYFGPNSTRGCPRTHRIYF